MQKRNKKSWNEVKNWRIENTLFFLLSKHLPAVYNIKTKKKKNTKKDLSASRKALKWFVDIFNCIVCVPCDRHPGCVATVGGVVSHTGRYRAVGCISRCEGGRGCSIAVIRSNVHPARTVHCLGVLSAVHMPLHLAQIAPRT